MTKPELQATRAAWGMSQSQMARTLGVSVRTLQGWEGGRPIPKWVGIMINLYEELCNG